MHHLSGLLTTYQARVNIQIQSIHSSYDSVLNPDQNYLKNETTSSLSSAVVVEGNHKAMHLTQPREVGLMSMKSSASPSSRTTQAHASVPCYILVENGGVDWHYELLESTVLHYPLPWKLLNCSPAEDNPVLFDFSVKKAYQGQNNESIGWRNYFHQHLQNTTRLRVDGVPTLFHQLTDEPNYPKKRPYYNAIIHISSCPHHLLLSNNRDFCVGHILHSFDRNWKNKTAAEQTTLIARTCWLNPMHQSCFFIPKEYPVVSSLSSCSDTNYRLKRTLRICTSGSGRYHEQLAIALDQLRPPDVLAYIHHRSTKIPKPYIQRNVTQWIKIVQEADFVNFSQSIGNCDIMLPLLDPKVNAGYFDTNAKKTSGQMGLAVGYKLPTIVHKEIFKYYKPYLEQSSVSYDDNKSFVSALEKVLKRKQADLELACG